VYQEQVIEIFRKLGGFSIGQADMIRRAMSKKKAAEIQREKKSFIEGDPQRGICGAVANGVPREAASGIYDEMSTFANYGFNKCHAVPYAVISYQTAYLKYHHPREYMAALLSSILDWSGKIAEYTEACREMGIRLLPPDINKSGPMFSVSGDDLRYGLVAAKNIGRGFINEVVAERERNGRFTDFEDFCKRMYGGDLNRRALESLIKCGCFDGLGANRRQLMTICQSVVDSVAEHRRRNVEGQLDLFGMSGTQGDCSLVSSQQGGTTPSFSGIELPDVPEFSKSELMRMEREVTGLYLSGHPMDEFRGAVKRAGAVSIGDILADFSGEEGNVRFKDNQKITVAGVVESVKTKATKNNSLMAYIELDDGSGGIEMLAFQRVIDESGGYMQPNTPVVAYGRLSARDEKEPQIVLDVLRPIEDVTRAAQQSYGKAGDAPAPYRKQDGQPPPAPYRRQDGQPPPVEDRTLFVKLPNEDSPEYERLKLVHMMFPGRDSMVIHFSDTNKNLGAKCIIHDALVKELREMLGEKNVVVR